MRHHQELEQMLKLKNPNFLKKKHGLEIWWIATFPSNVKCRVNLLGGFRQTTDARATTLALLTQ